MLLHPRTKEVKLISLSACAKHGADGFFNAAQCDLNIVDDFFNRDESQTTASQATTTQETDQSRGGNQRYGEYSSDSDEYSDDSDGN